MTDSLSALLEHVFDYAGLFPPAALPLDRAVARYAGHRKASHAWMLGRFVIPLDRVDALAAALPEHAGWPLSVLVKDPAAAGDLAGELSRMQAHAGARVRIEAVETVATSVAAVEALGQALPSSLERYIEVPFEPDPAELLAAVAATGCAAKFRTGGLVAEAFPTSTQVARFVERCRASGVPFKATGGLHHALRASYALTYEPASACGTMHGFVNLLMAAVLRSAMRTDEAGVRVVLEDEQAGSFRFGGRAAAWRREMVTTTEIEFARRTVLHRIGTCSLEEAVGEISAWSAAGSQ